MKLCINCKHYKETKIFSKAYARIDVNKVCTYFRKTSPVDGKISITEINCSTARSTSNLCGRTGDYFSRVKRENTSPWWRSWFNIKYTKPSQTKEVILY